MIKILLVDDTRDILMMIRGLLEHTFKNIEVTTAENGREGLEIFNQNKFDLIITDFCMPIMDGGMFVLSLRETNKDIPVIMFSSSYGIQDLVREAGVTEFVNKPDFEKLSQEISKQLATIN